MNFLFFGKFKTYVMKTENIIKDKSFEFAKQIVHLYLYLKEKRKIYAIADQILRSGTSIGANIEEADAAQTKKDFYAKLSISYKEAFETRYWLRLIRDTKLAAINEVNPLLSDLEEIIRILSKILTTTRKSLGYAKR